MLVSSLIDGPPPPWPRLRLVTGYRQRWSLEASQLLRCLVVQRRGGNDGLVMGQGWVKDGSMTWLWILESIVI